MCGLYLLVGKRNTVWFILQWTKNLWFLYFPNLNVLVSKILFCLPLLLPAIGNHSAILFIHLIPPYIRVHIFFLFSLSFLLLRSLLFLFCFLERSFISWLFLFITQISTAMVLWSQGIKIYLPLLFLGFLEFSSCWCFVYLV